MTFAFQFDWLLLNVVFFDWPARKSKGTQLKTALY